MQAVDCISGWCGGLCNRFNGGYIDEVIVSLVTAFIDAFI